MSSTVMSTSPYTSASVALLSTTVGWPLSSSAIKWARFARAISVKVDQVAHYRAASALDSTTGMGLPPLMVVSFPKIPWCWSCPTMASRSARIKPPKIYTGSLNHAGHLNKTAKHQLSHLSAGATPK